MYVSEWHGVRLENLAGITLEKPCLLCYIIFFIQANDSQSWGCEVLKGVLERCVMSPYYFLNQSFFNQWVLKCTTIVI